MIAFLHDQTHPSGICGQEGKRDLAQAKIGYDSLQIA
jgi:hypothetical protein